MTNTETTNSPPSRSASRLPHAHLVQLNIAWEDPAANFQAADRLIASADIHSGDFILLPEMFAVGFSINTAATAPHAPATIEYLTQLADDTQATVQAGFPTQQCDCNKARNRMLVLDGSHTDQLDQPTLLASYDKLHPFSFGKEPEAFEPGTDLATFNWNGLIAAPAICYDLRFPELFRALALHHNAQLFALGACWPATRQQHWRALAIARAIENQAFVLAANRTGSDPHLEYAGGSLIIDPQGAILAELDDQEAVLSAPIDPAAVHSWRSTFPALHDAKLIPPSNPRPT